jgi:hypothetical protein
MAAVRGMAVAGIVPAPSSVCMSWLAIGYTGMFMMSR